MTNLEWHINKGNIFKCFKNEKVQLNDTALLFVSQPPGSGLKQV